MTDTEVKLTPPDRITPVGRAFTIEGVVDIVQEQGRTVMYDIEYAVLLTRCEPTSITTSQQLNVYAHIWQKLRGQPLDEAAIIATRFPSSLRNALSSDNPVFIGEELAC